VCVKASRGGVAALSLFLARGLEQRGRGPSIFRLQYRLSLPARAAPARVCRHTHGLEAWASLSIPTSSPNSLVTEWRGSNYTCRSDLDAIAHMARRK